MHRHTDRLADTEAKTTHRSTDAQTQRLKDTQEPCHTETQTRIRTDEHMHTDARKGAHMQTR
eukprot:6588874-Alexandrium_andersonii.AAC.1